MFMCSSFACAPSEGLGNCFVYWEAACGLIGGGCLAWETVRRLRRDYSETAAVGCAWAGGTSEKVSPIPQVNNSPDNHRVTGTLPHNPTRCSSDRLLFPAHLKLLCPHSNPLIFFIFFCYFSSSNGILSSWGCLQHQDHFAKVIELDAENVEATTHLGSCQQRLGRHHEVRLATLFIIARVTLARFDFFSNFGSIIVGYVFKGSQGYFLSTRDLCVARLQLLLQFSI